MKDSIIFKGTKDGLTVILDKYEDFDVLKNNLKNRISSHKAFFNVSDMIITFKGRKINSNQFNELKEIVENYGFKTKVAEFNSFGNLYEGMTKTIKGTVRSGQKIEYNGNIVILGDINPGGEVVAAGNIIVMGVVRGLVHAGVSGNKNAIIVGFRLQPIQIRIADVLSRSPDDMERPPYPEFAYVKDNMIYIDKL